MLILLVPVLACSQVSPTPTPDLSIKSFKDCVAAGNKVMRSYPAKCATKDGRIFVQEIKRPLCKDLCGDGACQIMVCQGSGCPCEESYKTCPSDCR